MHLSQNGLQLQNDWNKANSSGSSCSRRGSSGGDGGSITVVLVPGRFMWS